MDINYYKFLVFILFVILSAYFSSTETAFTAINRIRLRHWFEKEKSGNIARLDKLLTQPAQLITAILIGNNFANVACTALGTTILIDILRQLNIENLAVAMPIITVIITLFLLIFGEITPKTLALKQPERYAVFSSRFLRPFIVVMKPIIFIFNLLNGLINKIFKISDDISKNRLTIDELKLMVDISHDEGVIHGEKNRMLTSVFEFSDIIVEKS